jgi:hypothetical protein
MTCGKCGHEIVNPQARFCGKCGASLSDFQATGTQASPAPLKEARSSWRLAVTIGAVGIMAIAALFIYLTRPGPCDGIFEQTAPKLVTTMHFLKTNGDMVIGRDKVQELAESSQRIGILCKTCCIAQQSGKITAVQFQDCLNTTKSYETQIIQVASSVDAANSAKQKGQVELVSEKTQQATQAASAAAGEEQKLDNNVTAFTKLSSNSNSASDTSSGMSPIPAKAVVVTKTDGTTLWIFEDSLTFNNSYTINLDSGQSVDFSKVKAVEILGVDSGKANLRLTLVDGRKLDGTEDDAGDYGVRGKNDLGDVNIPLHQIKQFVFSR